MLNDHPGALALTTTTSNNNLDQEEHEEQVESPVIRDIHALTPPRAPLPPRRESWDTNSHRSSSLSTGSSEINFSTMSREFNALVLAGSTITTEHEPGSSNLGRIREEENYHDTNPLAIVPDNHPLGPTSPRGGSSGHGGGIEFSGTTSSSNTNIPISDGEVSVHRVKKEEVDSKISAWQNAKIAKINNRFKREDAVINGWEGEQVQKATSWMKKIERKLEEKRAKALEKMQNDIAKARRKAEERKASAEAKRGTKVARVLELSNLMRAVGRPPVKRSFF